MELEPDLPVRMLHLEARAALTAKLEVAVSYLTGIPLPPELTFPQSIDESGEKLPNEVAALDAGRNSLEAFWREFGSEVDYAFLRWYAGKREGLLRASRGEFSVGWRSARDGCMTHSSI